MAESPLVLVHGAWQSAATWDLVAPLLRARGHHTLAATLTGLGPDAGPLTGSITLDAHIRDVVDLLERENLRDVVLVGHSYAGMIVSGAAELAAHRLQHLVYVDAFIADAGQSALQLLPAPVADSFRAQAAATGGWRLPAGEGHLDLWGLEPGPARDFVRERLCDFTLHAFTTPLAAPTSAAATLPRSYLACVREGYPARSVFAQFSERARREGWRYLELPSGHDCHVEMPQVVSDWIVAAASQAESGRRLTSAG